MRIPHRQKIILKQRCVVFSLSAPAPADLDLCNWFSMSYLSFDTRAKFLRCLDAGKLLQNPNFHVSVPTSLAPAPQQQHLGSSQRKNTSRDIGRIFVINPATMSVLQLSCAQTYAKAKIAVRSPPPETCQVRANALKTRISLFDRRRPKTYRKQPYASEKKSVCSKHSFAADHKIHDRLLSDRKQNHSECLCTVMQRINNHTVYHTTVFGSNKKHFIHFLHASSRKYK